MITHITRKLSYAELNGAIEAINYSTNVEEKKHSCNYRLKNLNTSYTKTLPKKLKSPKK